MATSSGNFRIVCRNGQWSVIGKDGKKGTKLAPGDVPQLGPPVTIEICHVIGPKQARLPKHPHKKVRKTKAGGSHAPLNTHCHKTVWIGGKPYLVHC